MPKLFSFASWNVRNFTNARHRIRQCAKLVSDANPDVFAIFEVLGKDVFFHFVDLMPSHNFFITEDNSTMDTLVGVRTNSKWG